MNIVSNQGRSLLEQLKALQEEDKTESTSKSAVESVSQSLTSSKLSSLEQDVYIPSTTQTSGTSEESVDNAESSAESAGSSGINVSFQFDLFYELSTKVEAQMGTDGASRFASLSASVAETFQSNFSLTIDGVGSFMNGTEKSLAISDETANEFFDAVEGMSELSPEALENFLKESDEFFAELEDTYGLADGALDDVKSAMQEQAKDFFASVEDARSEVLGTGATTEALPEGTEAAEGTETEGTESSDSLSLQDVLSLLNSDSEEEDDSNSLIQMLKQPETELTQNQYKDFLEKFQEYAEKMYEKLVEKMQNGDNSGSYSASLNYTKESTSISSVNILDTEV